MRLPTLLKRTAALPVLAALALGAAACTPIPALTDADIDDPTLGQRFGRGFLLGAATASHQVEGGLTNDWTEWEQQPGRIHGDARSGLACDSWNQFPTDLGLLRRLGANAYRLSVEWSRLEPQRGQRDAGALARYRGWMQQLRAAGITPMVTLHHFTLPLWVRDQGGWEEDRTTGDFVSFARWVTGELGAEVDLWVTLNEPNVYAVNSYLEGIWPPGHTDNVRTAKVLARLLEAHAQATAAIRQADTQDADGDGKAALVGVAHHMRILQPTTGSTLDGAIAALTDDFFNESTLEAARTGHIRLEVPGAISLRKEVPGLKGSFDFIGLNYYTRDHVRADLGDPAFSQQFVPEDRPRNDLGWELYPEGLVLLLLRLGQEGLPIYITENGMADEDGQERPRALRAHLAALQKALDAGVDVRGYLHWSLMDNFEWAEGYAPRSRFGLFRVDFGSPQRTRTPTPAVGTFQDVARNAGLAPQEG